MQYITYNFKPLIEELAKHGYKAHASEFAEMSTSPWLTVSDDSYKTEILCTPDSPAYGIAALFERLKNASS